LTILTTAPSLWRVEKAVAISHNLQAHRPSPVAVGFAAPPIATGIRFRPRALAAAIARTVTLRDAPEALLAQWARSSLLEVKFLIADGPSFEVSEAIRSLADAERTAFAGRVGAGITDLVMNGLGYTWRDNGACLAGSKSRPDFIYGGGHADGHGVVVAEAHGSFAEDVTEKRIERKANEKYAKQVKPHIGESCTHGKLVHGYSVAFGSNPTSQDTYLHVAEKKIPKPRRKSKTSVGTADPTRGGTPAGLALAAYRANFLLMGAAKVVAWIDWLRRVRQVQPEPSLSTFFVIEQEGRRFIAATEAFLPNLPLGSWLQESDSPPFWPYHLDEFWRWRGAGPVAWEDIFAMDESVAKAFLFELSALIRGSGEGLPEILNLPSVEPIGLTLRLEGLAADGEGRYPVTRFRDGLAILGRVPPSSLAASRLRWSPESGFDAMD